MTGLPLHAVHTLKTHGLGFSPGFLVFLDSRIIWVRGANVWAVPAPGLSGLGQDWSFKGHKQIKRFIIPLHLESRGCIFLCVEKEKKSLWKLTWIN